MSYATRNQLARCAGTVVLPMPARVCAGDCCASAGAGCATERHRAAAGLSPRFLTFLRRARGSMLTQRPVFRAAPASVASSPK